MKILWTFFYLLVCTQFFAQDLNFISHEPHKNQRNEFNQIFTVGEDLNGAIYAGGENSIIYKYYNKEWTDFVIPGSNNLVQEITGNMDGQLFVAIQNEGLWLRANNQWQLFDSDNSMYPMTTNHGGIAWDELNGILWVGTDNGLVSLKDGNVMLYNYQSVGIEMIDDEILDLAIDSDGSIWMISSQSTLIHFKDDKFTSQPVGWDLAKFDLSFEKLAIKSSGDIVITTSNYGLLNYNRKRFEFDQNFGSNFYSIAIDKLDNTWLTDENTLWKHSMDNLISYSDPIIPIRLFEIYVSADNHIWLGGQNGSIIEIVQNKVMTKLNEMDNNTTINLFPNPLIQGDCLQVELSPSNVKLHLSIYSIFGERVYTGDIVEGEFEFRFSEGAYILVFATKNGMVIKNIVVK